MKDAKVSSWFFCSTYSFKTCQEVCERRRSMPSQYRKCESCSLFEKRLEAKRHQAELTA
jgi:hypothetical protein